MYALYAFARISDDLADEPVELETKTERLAAWREVLQHVDQPVSVAEMPSCLHEFSLLWPALHHAVREFEIPVSLLDDIVQGVTMDLNQIRFDTWEELDQYCYYVASAVGLACTYIWKRERLASEREAVLCGQAFQLTNILRDVAEDATRERIYLPSELLEKHSINQSDWLAGQPQGNWNALVAEVVGVAEERYVAGWKTIELLSPDSQKMFSLIWRRYRMLLHELQRRADQLWGSERVRLGFWQKFGLVTPHFTPGMFRLLPRQPFPEPTSATGERT